MSKFLPIGCLLLLLAACAPAPQQRDDDGVLRIVATTGMIGDAASRVAGELAEVTALMGPGVDPHLYKASEGDVGRLSSADLIFYNGLHLEGKMGDVLKKVGRTRPVVAVAEGLPAERQLRVPGGQGVVDPHVWFDVALWSEVLDAIAGALAEHDPANAESYRANAESYRAELEALDDWVRESVARIPAEQRVLVTAHDAFGYFGRAYGLEVVGLQGISTISEAGLRDIERVVDTIVERRLPAIFVESSVPRRAIEAVQAASRARGHEVAIGGEFFSDAMGAADTPEGTYPGMVRHNVETIVGALADQEPLDE